MCVADHGMDKVLRFPAACADKYPIPRLDQPYGFCGGNNFLGESLLQIH